jgi:hypothetical protein
MRDAIDMRYCRLLPGIFALAAILCCGCGNSPGDAPELCRVRGRVTLDQQPLSNARVIFTPQGGGRAAQGTTDEDGNYDVAYSMTGMGVPAGVYVVSIKAGRDAEEDSKTGQSIPAVPETVPAVYNSKSKLSSTVPGKAGDYDFALESNSAKVVQPRVAVGAK